MYSGTLQQNIIGTCRSLRKRLSLKGKREKNNEALQEHVFGTYNSLRMGMAFISVAFPLFLWFIGWLWYNIPLQNSMSAYYFAESSGDGLVRSWLNNINIFPIRYLLFFLAELDGEAPMRSWFIGVLFVLGVLLYLYKGFSSLENNLLNVAGLSALMVAIFPMEWNCGDSCHLITIHGILAIVAFGCIAFVAVYCSKKTLDLLLDERKKKFYNGCYNVTGTLMILFPVLAFVITQIIGDNARLIFFVEWFGISSFAAYWWIKSRELEESKAELRALEKDPTASRELGTSTVISTA